MILRWAEGTQRPLMLNNFPRSAQPTSLPVTNYCAASIWDVEPFRRPDVVIRMSVDWLLVGLWYPVGVGWGSDADFLLDRSGVGRPHHNVQLQPIPQQLLQVSGWMDRQTDWWVDGRTDRWVDGQTDIQTHRQTGGWVDGWTDRQVGGWAGGRAGGRAGGQTDINKISNCPPYPQIKFF